MANPDPHVDSPPLAEITDSPWFWVCVFSAMALAGTIALAPKYEDRQGAIELRQEARLRSNEFAARVAAADGDRERVRREMAEERAGQGDIQRELAVRLTPIYALLSLAFFGSLGRVCWIQAKAEHAPFVDRRRAFLLLLVAIYCVFSFIMIWYAYSGASAINPADKDAYRAWATSRGMQTVLILLLMSILLTLGLTSLWKKRADERGQSNTHETKGEAT